MIPKLIRELDQLGRSDIMVFAGGVIPAQDYGYLFEQNVAAIFGPGTVIAEAAIKIMKMFMTNQSS